MNKLGIGGVVVLGLGAAVACGGSSDVGGVFDPNAGSSGSSGASGTSGSSGASGTSGFVPPTETLTVDPASATVFIDTNTTPATPGKQAFTVKLTKDGADSDVTSTASFELADKQYGSFTGNTFTSVTALPAGVFGVTTTVKVTAGQNSASSPLTIVQLKKTGDNRDFFFVEPYKAPPTPASDVLKFSTNIKKVDVAFVMDTTGSMGGSITNLQTQLTGTIVPALTAAIPSVQMAVVDHKDYPVSPYGGTTDWPVKVWQIMTPTVSLVSAGVGQYAASGGFDGPEAQIPAMQHTLTGEALSWTGGSLPAHVPAAGTFGGVDFRAGSVPVIVLITDIDWHGEGHTPYTGFTTPTMASLKTAFASTNARFVNVTSGDESQANELSDATKSAVPVGSFGVVAGCTATQCCTGVSGAGVAPTGPGGTCRLNFRHSNGTGVSTGIINAIQAISVGSTFDVTAKASNDPTNVDGVDATKFIKALRAKDEGDASQGCPAAPAKDSDGDGVKDTFLAVKVGTPVCFEIIAAQNETVPPKTVAQFYNAYIDVIGLPGSVNLDKRQVKFLVPPVGGSTK